MEGGRARAHLDEEVKEALVVVRGGRGVGPLDEFAVDGRRNRDVLSDGEAQDGTRWQRETVTATNEMISSSACVPCSVRWVAAAAATERATDIAVLGERTIFSVSLYFCHLTGSRAGLVSVRTG